MVFCFFGAGIQDDNHTIKFGSSCQVGSKNFNSRTCNKKYTTLLSPTGRHQTDFLHSHKASAMVRKVVVTVGHADSYSQFAELPTVLKKKEHQKDSHFDTLC